MLIIFQLPDSHYRSKEDVGALCPLLISIYSPQSYQEREERDG